MKNVKKISIVTTRQNFRWLSMTEILPSLEKCWEMAADDLSIEYKLINADEMPLKEYVQFLLISDLIVIIAFNEIIYRLMKQIRTTLEIDAPFAFHLHSHATVGLWPQYRFGVLETMNEGDFFIGTCPGDLHCMKATLENAKTIEIPYPYFPIKFNSTNINTYFAYIGRISDQKNLDLLIESYSILKLKKGTIPKLLIYGKEDFLGCPNMGIASTNCLENLLNIIELKNLKEDVLIKGYVEREQIYKELSINHIFVSPSIHSDENFGMALMRSMAMKATAVVSDWGGHKVFKKICPDNVLEVKVEFKEGKPTLSAEEFSQKMEESLCNTKKSVCGNFHNTLSAKNVAEEFKKIIANVKINKEKLRCTEVAQLLYKQQEEFELKGEVQRSFSSYNDPIAKVYLSSYAL